MGGNLRQVQRPRPCFRPGVKKALEGEWGEGLENLGKEAQSKRQSENSGDPPSFESVGIGLFVSWGMGELD